MSLSLEKRLQAAIRDGDDGWAAARMFQAQLETARREHLVTMIGIVKAAGGRIEVHQRDLVEVHRMELNRTDDPARDVVQKTNPRVIADGRTARLLDV